MVNLQTLATNRARSHGLAKAFWVHTLGAPAKISARAVNQLNAKGTRKFER